MTTAQFLRRVIEHVLTLWELDLADIASKPSGTYMRARTAICMIAYDYYGCTIAEICGAFAWMEPKKLYYRHECLVRHREYMELASYRERYARLEAEVTELLRIEHNEALPAARLAA
jgi:hypothetical protein